MGKASSNKKVARAAKAGGGRARVAGERNILFPAMLAAVVVMGTLLVVYARDDRSSEALEDPQIGDHWHAATGFYVCDGFGPPLGEFSTQSGLHTHGTDGIIHVEPSSSAGAGANANLANVLGDAGEVLGGAGLSDDSFSIPGGETYTEGEDSCDEGEGDPIVQVAVWSSPPQEEPERIVVANFDTARFDVDGRAFTVAFAPEGTDLPPPPNAVELPSFGVPTGEDDGTPPTTAGDAPPSTEGEQPSDAPADDSTSTTVPGAEDQPVEDTSSSSAPTTSAPDS